MVKKLLHTRYRVSDLEKTVSFYKDVLGLKEIRRHTSPRGSQLVFFQAPGSEEEIELCKFDESGPVNVGTDITHLAFEVDDLEAFAKHAATKGYPLSDGPTKTGSGGLIAFIDAPEGYEVELIQPGKKPRSTARTSGKRAPRPRGRERSFSLSCLRIALPSCGRLPEPRQKSTGPFRRPSVQGASRGARLACKAVD